MSCCDDEIIIETTVDEIIITEGNASGVSAAEVADAIAAAIDALPPASGAQTFAYAASVAASAADRHVYKTFAEAHAAAVDWVANGGSARVMILDGNIPAGAFPFSGSMWLAGGAPNSFALYDEGTTFPGLARIQNLTPFNSGAQAGRTEPLLGSGSDNINFVLEGFGSSIIGSSSYAGAVPLWRDQTGGRFTVAFDGVSMAFGNSSANLVSLGASAILDIEMDAVASALNLGAVSGTGAQWTFNSSPAAMLSGVQPVGVTTIVDSSLRDTNDVPEGASNLYHTDARVDARIGAARVSSWVALTEQWQAAPTLAATIASGDVYSYTYDDGASGTTTRYRLVPSTYSAAADAFYTGFDGTNLTGLVTTRAMEVTP